MNPSTEEIIHAVQRGPEAHPTPCTMGVGLLAVQSGRSVVLANHLLLVSGCEMVAAVPLPPVCACLGVQWLDLHIYSLLY